MQPFLPGLAADWKVLVYGRKYYVLLRRTRPDAPRPYRVWGYPWVPAIFVLSSAGLVANTLWEKPVESLWGLALVASGLPVYWWWRRRRGA